MSKPLQIQIVAEPLPEHCFTGLRTNVINIEGEGITGALATGVLPPNMVWIEINGKHWSFDLADVFRQAIAQVTGAVEDNACAETVNRNAASPTAALMDVSRHLPVGEGQGDRNPPGKEATRHARPDARGHRPHEAVDRRSQL